MKTKTSELKGAALDWAVAMATKAWETAHELFPTWTLDSKFSGIRVAKLADIPYVQLVPRNPMRQDPQLFNPSQNWAHGGPLVDDYQVALIPESHDGQEGAENSTKFIANVFYKGGEEYTTSPCATALIAAMQAIVATVFGDEVEIPEELCEAAK